MPSQRSRAAFQPIAPDLDVEALVDSTPSFEFVPRMDCNSIDNLGLKTFERLVLGRVILGGKPLVIGGFNERLDLSIFSEGWLRTNYSSKKEDARDLTAKSNVELSIGHYLNNMPLLTNQWNEHNYTDTHKQRLYLKDIDCPPEWCDALKKAIPPSLFYLNQSPPEDFRGPGANLFSTDDDSTIQIASKQPIAKAGDLMSCLPPQMRAQNLMCYIGHEGTYTPAHQEMCASLGQNIMVEASDGSLEGGQPTKPGSSIWFMTESKDRKDVSEYWMSALGHDIDIEDHFAQINAWKLAPFTTYIVEQRPGDLILIPPLAAHQVWNRGTRTMKVAWNRTTVQTLDLALNEALPHARMVCRDEQYKNKAIVYCSLQHYSTLLKGIEAHASHPEVQMLRQEFQDLFVLYTRVFDMSMWAEQFRWKELKSNYDAWRDQLIGLGCPSEDYKTSKMIMFDVNTKTLAETCQEQLKLRPFVDITKPDIPRIEETAGDSENISPAHKRRKINSSISTGNVGRCHICRCAEPMWKLASCSECHLKYCYGSLFRAFNIQPKDVMELYHWKCPKCEKICSCAACRRIHNMKPVEPSSTLLGHDTSKIADPRSVQVLFDYRQSNLRWLKKTGDNETYQLRKHQEEADAHRSLSLVEHSIQIEQLSPATDPNAGHFWLQDPVISDFVEDMPLDPVLASLDSSFMAADSFKMWGSIQEVDGCE
ncbi:hypothetical protein FE257_003152 [Aspergillus nanangensis]|uniref:JmjC domain-containing protein n=1 Tax=Aspergillus nanangensis TaxID=2582783 RepID=A0AAD4CBV1_ASPNN|nr:hypothetical protein FE257_003152 [Aspergillus nanangensis]